VLRGIINLPCKTQNDKVKPLHDLTLEAFTQAWLCTKGSLAILQQVNGVIQNP